MKSNRDDVGEIRLSNRAGGPSPYRSVIAEGTAKWVEEPREKARALAALVRKYSGQHGVKIPPGGLEGVVVIRIPLSAMTGKVSTGS